VFAFCRHGDRFLSLFQQVAPAWRFERVLSCLEVSDSKRRHLEARTGTELILPAEESDSVRKGGFGKGANRGSERLRTTMRSMVQREIFMRSGPANIENGIGTRRGALSGAARESISRLQILLSYTEV